MKGIEIVGAVCDRDIEGILQLQQKSLRQNLSLEEARQEGFVTLEHHHEQLRAISSDEPHVIAKKGDKVVGYALVMDRASAPLVPALAPMFERIDKLKYNDLSLAEASYVVMGQVCIDEALRGQGLFRRLYNAYKDRLSSRFDYVVTEISGYNQRSQQAHLAIGFEIIDEYLAPDGAPWIIVLWRL